MTKLKCSCCKKYKECGSLLSEEDKKFVRIVIMNSTIRRNKMKVTKEALETLENIVSELPNDIICYRGIPITEFDKCDLVKICKLIYFDKQKRK